MKKYQLLIIITLLAPSLAAAQVGSLSDIIYRLMDIIQFTLPVVMGFALLVFFWGVAKFILSSGGDNDRGQGKQLLLWGTIGLFVMVSLWSIVQVLKNTLFN